MRKVLCSIQDRKSEQFGPILAFMNDADAIRSFTDAVNSPSEESLLYKHASDFDLFRIGTFETDDGVISPENHRRLLTGEEAKAVIQKPQAIRSVQ